jgi:hypothetical protein
MTQPNNSTKKIYTFRVQCSFELECSFTEDEVEPEPGGTDEDFNPTDEAILTLEKELREALGANYHVTSLEAFAESDELIGISDEEGNIISADNED